MKSTPLYAVRKRSETGDNLILNFGGWNYSHPNPIASDENSMNERRIENRLLCAELVELIWKDDLGRTRRRVANLEDISLSGICLQIESALAAGTEVKMHYGDGELAGIVRYCVFRDFGYFLGVELSEGCRWSTQHFRPQHLLDPQELVRQAMLRHQSEKAPELIADQTRIESVAESHQLPNSNVHGIKQNTADVHLLPHTELKRESRPRNP